MNDHRFSKVRKRRMTIGLSAGVYSLVCQFFILLKLLHSDSTYAVIGDAWMTYWPVAIVCIPIFTIISASSLFDGRFVTFALLLFGGILTNSYLFVSPTNVSVVLNLVLAGAGIALMVAGKLRSPGVC